MMKPMLVCVVLFALAQVSGQGQSSTNANPASQIQSQLKFRQGMMVIGRDLATVETGQHFRYLGEADARIVLEKLWGNPEGHETLGMLVPQGIDLTAEESWAVVLTYEGTGHVKDDDAEKIDSNKLLADMKKATKAANKYRVKEGYPPVELVGWAKPPHYDKQTKKLHWAKELKFSDSPENTLNYDFRALARKGVLVMTVVGTMKQLESIEALSTNIVSLVTFNPGSRYEDFNPQSDQLATYGIAALIAGGVAAKTGLLKGLLVALLAAKKVLVLGVLAIFALVAKLVKRRAV